MRPADARALPLGPPGGGARGVPEDARKVSSTGSASSRAPLCAIWNARSSTRTSRSRHRAPRRGAASQRRPALVLAGAALALVAVAAITFAVTRDSAGGLDEVPPNYLGMIDPETNTVVAAIPVGIRPGPVVSGAGSIWVGNLQDRNLTRIDPKQRTVAAVVSLDDRTPTGLAVGAGAVWIAHGLGGELSRVEPQFGRVTQTITVTRRSIGRQRCRRRRIRLGRVRRLDARPDPIRHPARDGLDLHGRPPRSRGRRWRGRVGRQRGRGDRAALRSGHVRRRAASGRSPSAAGPQRSHSVREPCGSRTEATTPSRASTRARTRPSTSASATSRPASPWAAIRSGSRTRRDGTVSRIDPASNDVVADDRGRQCARRNRRRRRVRLGGRTGAVTAYWRQTAPRSKDGPTQPTRFETSVGSLRKSTATIGAASRASCTSSLP